MVDFKPEFRSGAHEHAETVTDWANRAHVPRALLAARQVADEARGAIPETVRALGEATKAMSDAVGIVDALPLRETVVEAKDAVAAVKDLLRAAEQQKVLEKVADATTSAKSTVESAQTAIDNLSSLRTAAMSVVGLAVVSGAFALYNQSVAVKSQILRTKVESCKLDLLYRDRTLGADSDSRCKVIVAACNYFARVYRQQAKDDRPDAAVKIFLVDSHLEDFPGLSRLAETDEDFRNLLDASVAAEQHLMAREQMKRTPSAVLSVFILVETRDIHISAPIRNSVKIARSVATNGFRVVAFGTDAAVNLHSLRADCEVDRVSGVAKVLACETLGVSIE
ncbi:hypothetical protein LTR53_001657 [Teratosphaeriaceae sp. CCFEE 6253]|nr:hypothetical protein LTR53_001657 [Teratosphaeriaceae sp. CCFEE 6253]